jgi:futalosine hydrolase
MLLLVPTIGEARVLVEPPFPVDEQPVRTRVADRDVWAALCGFGPVAAGVMASRALGLCDVPEVVLAGIAGTLAPGVLGVGSVLCPSSVRMVDLGRGRGEETVGPAALGLPQVAGAGAREAIYDVLTLSQRPPGGTVAGELLCVPAAAGSPQEAAERAKRHPGALAEDMEGFAVALAARLAGRRLTILRGISNVAGEVDHTSWEVERALAAVRDLLGPQ